MTTKLKKNVKLNHDILHYIPCSTSNVRTKGWQEIKKFPWGHLEMRAWETINVTDIFVLIAAIKTFQDHITDIQAGEIISDRKTLTLKVELWRFAKFYVKSNDYRTIEQHFKRLSSFQVFCHSNTGEMSEQRFILGFDIKTDEKQTKWLTVIMNKELYDACINRGLTINFSLLQDITGQTARALFMYITGQKSKAFYQQTLETALNLQLDSYENRRRIKEAFDALKAADCITEAKLVKNTPGYLFSYF